jgi:hypothetical protein
MTDMEISEVVTRILRDRFNQFGFAGARVRSDIDFDGTPIIRVTGSYENGRVPTRRLIDTLDDIRSELIDRGEDRIVFLDSEYPGVPWEEDDVED